MDMHDNRGNENKGLSSTEYRARLLTKLNCLVAVLEVAIAKISKSLDLPGANQDRLLKIKSNLQNTLSICKRAKQTLENNMAEHSTTQARTSRAISTTDPAGRRKMSYRDYVELSSIDEYNKFKGLPPISEADVSEVDIDGLINQLFD